MDSSIKDSGTCQKTGANSRVEVNNGRYVYNVHIQFFYTYIVISLSANLYYTIRPWPMKHLQLDYPRLESGSILLRIFRVPCTIFLMRQFNYSNNSLLVNNNCWYNYCARSFKGVMFKIILEVVLCSQFVFDWKDRGVNIKNSNSWKD